MLIIQFLLLFKLLQSVVCSPTKNNDIVKNFQTGLQQQNLQTILSSIEDRLRNLDNIYSMHLSTTLNDKLNQYQHKFQTIETKLTRFESLMQLNLDKLSENMSTKYFKDELFKTNLIKKIDSVYEGISHRLNYMDLKFESSLNKIQTKLEQTEDTLTKRNEDLESGLSETISTLDNLKLACLQVEKRIVNNSNENFEIAMNEHINGIKSYSDKINNQLEIVSNQTNAQIERSENRIIQQINVYNVTSDLKMMRNELKRELNEYAIKVAEMNSENWKTSQIITDKTQVFELLLNSTKIELQTNLRTISLLLGKITKENSTSQLEPDSFRRLNAKIDEKFEKVYAAQNTFKDSCYRLQMDEPQIERKISEILEQIIETFDQKTAIELKDIKNLEKLIKGHDSHSRKHLGQVGAQLERLFKAKIDQIELASPIHFQADIAEIKHKIRTLTEQRQNMTNLLSNIKAALQCLPSKPQLANFDETNEPNQGNRTIDVGTKRISGNGPELCASARKREIEAINEKRSGVGANVSEIEELSFDSEDDDDDHDYTSA